MERRKGGIEGWGEVLWEGRRYGWRKGSMGTIEGRDGWIREGDDSDELCCGKGGNHPIMEEVNGLKTP